MVARRNVIFLCYISEGTSGGRLDADDDDEDDAGALSAELLVSCPFSFVPVRVCSWNVCLYTVGA